MLGLHLHVKVLEILLTPVATVFSPTMTGMDPGILSIEVLGVFRWGIIFVDQPRRAFPGIHLLSNLAPICVSVLGEDKDHWAALVEEVSVPSGRVRPDVGLVGFVHGG